MKKFFLMLFFVITGLTICAQDKLNTGLNIGYCSSTFLGNDKPGKGLAPVSSALLGGYVRYCFSDRFSFQSEINYYAKGSRINTIDNLYEYVYLNYLEIPAMILYRFRYGKKLQPLVFAGPALDINTVSSGSRGYLTNVKNTDCSLIAGTGFELWKLSFQVRYICGLTKFDNSNQKLDLRNSSVSLLVGLNFLNKK